MILAACGIATAKLLIVNAWFRRFGRRLVRHMRDAARAAKAPAQLAVAGSAFPGVTIKCWLTQALRVYRARIPLEIE